MWLLAACQPTEITPAFIPAETEVIFHTDELDRVGIVAVTWSSGGLILSGWDLPATTFPFYLANPDSGEVTQFAMGSTSVNGRDPTVSPTDLRVAFFDFDAQAIRVVELANPGQNEIRIAIKGNIAWSPDGTHLAVVRKGPGGVVIETIELATQSRKTIFQSLDSDVLGYGGIAWSPDGTKIAFELSMPSSVADKSQSDMFILDLQTQHALRVTNTPHISEEQPSWAPTSEQLLFTAIPADEQASGQLGTVRADGTCLTQIDGLTGVVSAALSPDGTQVAVVAWSGVAYIISASAAGVHMDGARGICP